MNLKHILEKHVLWLKSDPNGEKANLRGADLYGANLRGANLRGADLRGANLLIFQYQRDMAYFTGKDIRIGCEYFDVKVWAKDYRKIGKKHNYTKQQIDAYGYFIKYCLKLSKLKKGETK